MSVGVPMLAAMSLAAFAVVSAYDAFVVHFFVERLPLRSDSWLEHRLHTGRAVVFPGILLAFFGGASAPLGWALLAVDQVLELWDQAVERESRVHTGGLPTKEYLVHGILTTLRALAIAFTALVDRRSGDVAVLDTLVATLFPGAIVAALIHVLLATDSGRSVAERWGRAS